MKINKPHSKVKHLAVAVSVVFGLAACSSDDDDPIVIANNAPVVSSTVVTAADEGVPYTYTFTATDADADDTLVLASVTAPAWLNFDTATGILSGTPAAADIGDNAVSLSVSDGTDTVAQDFTIVVAAAPVVNTAPVFSSTALAMGTVGTAYSYTATATDADANDTLSFSSVTLPTWAMFETSTAVLSGTPDMAGDYPVELMVSDGTDDASQMFTITVAADNAVTVALNVFENAVLAEWAPWISSGGSTAVVTDDAEHDQTVQFNLTENSVAGFTARDVDGAVGGMPFDASGVTNATLSFELKMIKAPDAGVVDWKLKIEGPGTAAEVSLSTAVEAHATPLLDTWQTYTFPLASLGGNLDISMMDLFMVFPDFSNATGTEFLVDNMMIVEGADDGGQGGEVVSISVDVFTDTILDTWSIWTEQGAGAPFTDGDIDYGVTAQFIIDSAGNGVAGFSGRATENMGVAGTPIDISAIVDTATISFDLKMLAAPNSGSDTWFLKLEDTGTGSSAEIDLNTSNEGHTTPVLDTWLSYSFKVSDINAGSLDFSAIDLIMIFPQWGTNGSANYLVDNFVITTGGDTGGGGNGGDVATGGIADVGDTGFVTNGGFEAGTLDSWLAEGANIAVELDDMGTYLAKIVAPEAQNPFIKQSRIGEGTITAGQALTVSFDMKGTVAGGGGVVNAILFTEAPSGVSKTDNLATVVPNAEWTNYSYNVTAGSDTEWGVAILLQPACGAVAGCEVTAYFDNVVITAN